MQHTTSSIARRRSSRHALRGVAGMDMLRLGAIGLLVLALIGLAIWAFKHMSHGGGDAPKRQVARIAVLPDTPPPPPPPPPKERKEESPKEVQRSQPVPDNTPKAPANEPIKMEGAAGNGPSAFQSGSVTQEYKGGTPNQGGAGGTGVADRAAERLYASSVRQLLRDEIERQLAPDASEIQASFSVWISADGRIGRWEVEPGTADASALNQALTKCADSLRLPAPNAVPQPMRFKLTLRANG